MMTAFLTRSDVSRHLQALVLLNELRTAVAAGRLGGSLGTGASANAVSSGPMSALLAQAALEKIPAFVVTVRSLAQPTARSVLQLHAAGSGQLLALMDAGHLMTLRASLMSALAADVLARPDAKNVAVLGAGSAASSALKALRLVRSIEQVWLFEPSPVDNFELAHRLQNTLSMAVHAVDTVHEAVATADIIVLTGQVPLADAVLAPGAHVTVLAADTFLQAPVSSLTVASARRFCDATESALAWGFPFHGLLGEVLAGLKPGRQTPEELTLFTSVGPPALDLLAAWHVYEGARHDEGLTRIDLET